MDSEERDSILELIAVITFEFAKKDSNWIVGPYVGAPNTGAAVEGRITHPISTLGIRDLARKWT